ncbi:hypothetical protein [Geobacter sp. SVR]|uniref:hypothetical protein n=1 Tax=Geobacter sp. SVR TaxID=2495594 RepID=UPI00143F01EB|nr:hypothetical protein [Geobacter sp. SVR]BCS52184.1 hypothetical protein GSVR_04920 [Geobacter sp. SVR]GCF85154.1 hypothetical protein GSbR_17540 [Geobacter sp. SVR]
MNRKTVAVLLNALVLPGLGQLYLGRKLIGAALLMLVNLLLLLAVFVVLKGLTPVIAAKIASSVVKPDDVLAALENIGGFGKALLGGFVAVWAYALVDIIRFRDGS